MPRRLDFAPAQGVEYGATALLRVRTARETAVLQVRAELRERLREMSLEFQIQFLRLERRKAGSIDGLAAARKIVDFDMPRGMASAA